MNKYAMILYDRVIEVVESDTVPVWPPDISGNIVIPVLCDDTIERGRSYDFETGEFGEYVYHIEETPTPEPLTLAEERQIDTLLNTEYIACLLESQLT